MDQTQAEESGTAPGPLKEQNLSSLKPSPRAPKAEKLSRRKGSQTERPSTLKQASQTERPTRRRQESQTEKPTRRKQEAQTENPARRKQTSQDPKREQDLLKEQDSPAEYPHLPEPVAQRLLLQPDPYSNNGDSWDQDYNSGAAMWEMDAGDRGADCDCLGPPPQFLLPPPPRPPLLQPPDYFCSDDPIPDLEACDNEPTIDASYHSNPSFQTPALIALFSLLLGLGIFIGALVIWKHKRKVANLFPCKSAARGVPPPAPAALYEDLADLADLSHRPPDSQLEMLDVKLGTHFPSGYPVSRSPPVFLRSSPGPEPYRPREHEPVYEELHRRRGDPNDSDGDFAGDELSLAGELPPAPCISTIHREVSRRPRGRPPTSLPHQRKPQQRPHNRAAEFHEGLLLDALLRLYPTVGTVGAPRAQAWDNCAPHRRMPCEPCAPCAPCAPYGPCPPTACSRDSLGSDSGYSNTTGGTRASSRARRDMNFS